MAADGPRHDTRFVENRAAVGSGERGLIPVRFGGSQHTLQDVLDPRPVFFHDIVVQAGADQLLDGQPRRSAVYKLDAHVRVEDDHVVGRVLGNRAPAGLALAQRLFCLSLFGNIERVFDDAIHVALGVEQRIAPDLDGARFTIRVVVHVLHGDRFLDSPDHLQGAGMVCTGAGLRSAVGQSVAGGLVAQRLGAGRRIGDMDAVVVGIDDVEGVG